MTRIVSANENVRFVETDQLQVWNSSVKKWVSKMDGLNLTPTIKGSTIDDFDDTFILA